MATEPLHRGELFILSAPSGTGKTTLIRSLTEGSLGELGDDLAFAVSHTTRAPRDAEVDGRDYHFVETAVFEEMMADDRFLEWAEVHNNYYGTSIAEVLPRIERGVDVIMDIDVQGAERVLGLYSDPATPPLETRVHSIFIMPPGYGVLKDRLEQRSLDAPQEISRRLAVARWEIKRWEQYDYVIINDDAVEASHILASIILDKRHRRERMRGRAAELLAEFVKASAAPSEDSTRNA